MSSQEPPCSDEPLFDSAFYRASFEGDRYITGAADEGSFLESVLRTLERVRREEPRHWITLAKMWGSLPDEGPAVQVQAENKSQQKAVEAFGRLLEATR